jgi:hypothetical protein
VDPKSLSFLSLVLFPIWIVVNDINFGSTKVIQWVSRRHKTLTHGQERLSRKVTSNSVSILSFVEWLDTFSYVLRPADVTVKEVNHIRCFAIDIAKDCILLSCRLATEHLCVLQLETSLATLVTTWFTLADRRWRSRYRSSDQCFYVAGMLQRVVQGTTWPAFHFFQFLSNDDGQCLKFSLKKDGKWEQGEPVCWSFFLFTPGGHFC